MLITAGGAMCGSFVVFGGLSVLLYKPWRRRIDSHRERLPSGTAFRKHGNLVTSDQLPYAEGMELAAGPVRPSLVEGVEPADTVGTIQDAKAKQLREEVRAATDDLPNGTRSR